MSFVGRYLGFHIAAITSLFESILLKTTGSSFVRLFNVRSMLMGRNVRIAWDGKEYSVRDDDVPQAQYVFRHERQGNMAYKEGLKVRAEKLGSVYFLPLVDFKNGDLVFDCGANLGDLKLWFQCHNIDVEYVGFEPSPVEFKCASRNVAPSTVHNVGLWNAEGEMKFYVSSQGADSSLIEPNEYDETITVRTMRVEQFIGRKIKFFKLEAEGAEPEILDGLGDKISQIEYISADLGPERGKSRESTLVPVVNYMASQKFDLVQVSHDRICALFRNKDFK
jgi:FkbM family methyltransferase